MAAPDTNADAGREREADAAHEIGLRAMVFTLVEPQRAMRLLDVTGLDPRSLRDRTGDPAMLAAVLSFLEAHEPDLLECAEWMDMPPAALVAARRLLEQA